MLGPRSKLRTCHRCKDPIHNLVYVNTTCDHLSCGKCYFARMKIYKTNNDFCWTCNDMSQQVCWMLSKELTNENGTMLMCLLYLQKVILFLLVLSCIVLLAGFPRTLHYAHVRFNLKNAPESTILATLPYTYYWFGQTLIVTGILYLFAKWSDVR